MQNKKGTLLSASFGGVGPKLAIQKFFDNTINKAFREAILSQDFLDANNFFMEIAV